MSRWIQIASISFVLALASAVNAQSPLTCGIVEVNGTLKVDPGTTLVFKVKVASMLHTSKPEFKWHISAGTITNGQGTDEITVDTAGLAGQIVTATVELIGAPFGCNRSASRTTGISPPPPISDCAFDSYGDIDFEDEKARLDNFGIQLENQPDSRGIILMYAGQKTFEREAAYRLDRVRSYLSNYREIDSIRIITLDCGFTKDLTARLMIVPLGATVPECDSGAQIPFSDVQFTKPRPKSSN